MTFRWEIDQILAKVRPYFDDFGENRAISKTHFGESWSQNPKKAKNALETIYFVLVKFENDPTSIKGVKAFAKFKN